MLETGEVQQDQTPEARNQSLRERTTDFFLRRHKFATGIGIGQTISTNILLFNPNTSSVIFNTLIGAVGGVAVGIGIDYAEGRMAKKHEEKLARREARRTEQRRKLSEPPQNE